MRPSRSGPLEHLKQFFEFLEAYEALHRKAHALDVLGYYHALIEAGDDGELHRPGETSDSVNVMSVHAAKGLEFRIVFVVNLVEERFPTRDRGTALPIPAPLIKESVPESGGHLSEERRLMYVALTRAKERVYLTSADSFGGVRRRKASRFVGEIERSGLMSVREVQAEESPVFHRRAARKSRRRFGTQCRAFSFHAQA